jgi:hypothetical protein
MRLLFREETVHEREREIREQEHHKEKEGGQETKFALRETNGRTDKEKEEEEEEKEDGTKKEKEEGKTKKNKPTSIEHKTIQRAREFSEQEQETHCTI